MPESLKPPLAESIFRLPDNREVEVVFLELPDGRIIARAKDELELVEKSENAPSLPPTGESKRG